MANSSSPSEGYSTPVSLTANKHRHHHGTVSRTTDLTKTPGGSIAKVTFNDDEAERRERRLQSNLCTMLSPGCHTPRSAVHSSAKRVRQGVESVTSSLTNSQLKEHYANCIKLSTQNRINAKNAFGLHLIDHMLQLLTIQGEMTNFQVASSTLDASAKIYAGRVDSIYTDALKVLTGFGRGGQNQNEAPEQTENDTVEGDTEGSKVTGKTKKTPSAGVNKVIEKNIRNLNVNTFDLEYQVDPLFKKTSAAFDEGGVEGLLINHLHTDPGFLLSLDADAVPSHKDQPVTHSVDIPVTDLRKVVSVGQMTSRQLCPTFTGLLSGDSKDDGGLDIEQATTNVGSISTSQVTDIGAEYSMLPCPQLPPDLTTHDDDEGVDAGQVDDNEINSPHEIADLTVLGSDNKMAGFIPGTAPVHSSDKGQPQGPLVLSEAIRQSDYSYFAPSVLATWAGPKHWKIQPKTSDNADEDKRKRRKPSTQFNIDFSETSDETLLTKGKASVQLSKPVLAKRSSVQNTLPENPHTEADVLHKLFSRPQWEVRRRSSNAVEDTEDQLEGNWYDYGNLHDNANFCPHIEDDSDGEVDAGGGLDLPLSQDDGFFSQSHSQDDHAPPPPTTDTDFILTGDNLVPQPRKVQQIHIEYAKAAKRLDVKKLKGKMWNLLTLEKTADSTSGGGDKTEENGRLNFSALCRDLPSQLTNEMRKNISVPICFVCLLHLANEKCLDISGMSGLSDLQIVAPPALTD